jgi:lipoate-protein ligase A
MALEASQKVPDGKMVEIELETGSAKVKQARIRGDFFLEPPEKLEELEARIEGLETDTGKEKIVEELETVEADMIGFSPEDVAEAFQKAVKEGGNDE